MTQTYFFGQRKERRVRKVLIKDRERRKLGLLLSFLYILSFGDALHYYIARQFDLTLVSFDKKIGTKEEDLDFLIFA